MKQFNSYKYILLSCLILGIFANWAQNDYGVTICEWSIIGLIVLFISEAIGLARTKVKNIAFIFFGICLATVIVAGNLGFPKIAISGSFLFAFFWTFMITYPFTDFGQKKTVEHEIKYYASESFMLFLFSTGIVFKMQHWPGASVILILGCGGLFILCLLKIIRTFRKEKNLPGIFKLSRTTLLLFVAIGYFLSFMFRWQHWPGWRIQFWTGVVLLFISILLFVIFRKPVNFQDSKTSAFRNIWNLKGNIRFIIIVTVFSSLHALAAFSNIAPRFYSLSLPPAFDKFVEKNEERKASDYRASFLDFCFNRDEIENNKSK
jgi:hypothetical protein